TMRVAGPDLGAVDDIVVTVPNGAGLQRGQVRTGTGLGISLTPDLLAGQDLRQVLLFLLLGAVAEQHRADHPCAEMHRPRCAAEEYLLLEDVLLRDVQSGPASVFRPVGGDPAALAQ